MNKLQEIQDNAVNNFSAKARSGFDPATILVIIELVSLFIEKLQDCRQPQEATSIVNRPSWLQVRILNMKTRQMLGYRAYRDVGSEVVDAILETGKNITEQDMQELFEEFGN